MRQQDVTIGFRGVDQTESPEFYIRFLDECNELDSVRTCKLMMKELLNPKPGQKILDVGCGVGEEVRNLGQSVGADGLVVGVDNSVAMIAEASRRNTDTELPVEFRVGDALCLDFADATFDACRSERLLMHLVRPQQALDEMMRVTKPGGRVVVFDFDWYTLSFSNCDEVVSRSIAHVMCRQMNSGRVGRELREMFQQAGFAEIVVSTQTLTAPPGFWRQVLKTPLEQAQQETSSTEIRQWQAAISQTDFVGTIQGFVVAGTRPQSSFPNA